MLVLLVSYSHRKYDYFRKYNNMIHIVTKKKISIITYGNPHMGLGLRKKVYMSKMWTIFITVQAKGNLSKKKGNLVSIQKLFFGCGVTHRQLCNAKVSSNCYNARQSDTKKNIRQWVSWLHVVSSTCSVLQLVSNCHIQSLVFIFF